MEIIFLGATQKHSGNVSITIDPFIVRARLRFVTTVAVKTDDLSETTVQRITKSLYQEFVHICLVLKGNNM